MSTQTWKWANLNNEQMNLLSEAEKTLGADYLLVYQPGEARDMDAQSSQLSVAQLNDSQLECLRGLENRLDAVVVAYGKTNM
jgi:hypothetical protein